MKKLAVSLLFSLLLPVFGFSLKTKILNVETGVPVIISLASKHDGGNWVLDSKPDALKLENRRKGYLYSYFIFKSQQVVQGPIIFKYKNGKAKDSKTYFVKVAYAPHKKVQNTGKTKELVVVSEKSSRQQNVKVPGNIKKYINNLIEEGLFEEAKKQVNRLLEGEGDKSSKVSKNWLIKKKISIMEKQSQHKAISAYISSLLQDGADNKINSEEEFYLRLSRAKADYRSGAKKKAQAQFIYLKNYYPDNPVAYYELGNFYFGEKQIKKGVSLFEYLASRFTDPPAKDEVYYRLAQYYYQVVGLNGYNLSYQYYKKILRMGMISDYYSEAKKMTEFLEKNFINIR